MGLCFPSVKPFAISKSEVQKNEHPTKVVSINSERKSWLSLEINKKWSWSQVYDENNERLRPHNFGTLNSYLLMGSDSITKEGLILATVMGDSKKEAVKRR